MQWQTIQAAKEKDRCATYGNLWIAGVFSKAITSGRKIAI